MDNICARCARHFITSLIVTASPFVAIKSASAHTALLPNEQTRESRGEDGNAADIVVTAERRETRLVQTPIAVTALGQRDIERYRLTDIRSLTSQAPGLFQPGQAYDPSDTLIYIRGLGEADSNFPPNVAIYIDGVYYDAVIGANADRPDLERVEVSRGPQGTLYGRNSAGGAINFVTRQPDEHLSIFAEAGAGSLNRLDGNALVSGQISDDLYGSIGVFSTRRDGMTKSAITGIRSNNVDLSRATLKLRALPSDRLELRFKAEAARDTSANAYVPVRQPNGIGGGDLDPDRNYTTSVPFRTLHQYDMSLQAILSLSDQLTAKSITALQKFDYKWRTGSNGGTSYYVSDNYIRQYDRLISQELQLVGSFNKLKFVGGIYLYDQIDSNERHVPLAATGRDGFGTLSVSRGRYNLQSAAAYGEATLTILPALDVTVGGRYTYDNEDFSSTGLKYTGVFPTFPGATVPANPGSAFDVSPSKSFDHFTPKGSIQYHLGENATAYASVSTGYKAGGFDPKATVVTVALSPYDSETLTTYEGGIKASLFGGRLYTSLVQFYNQIRNIQVTAYDVSISQFRRVNAANGYTAGTELELNGSLTNDLSLRLSVAHLITQYRKFTTTLPGNSAGRTTLVGLRYPFSPKWSLGFGVTYDLPIEVPGKLSAGVDGKYSSRYFSDVYNTPQLSAPPQWLVNAQLAYKTPDGRWTFTGRVTNLFNNRKLAFGTDYSPSVGPAPGLWDYIPQPPRLALFTIAYRLNK